MTDPNAQSPLLAQLERFSDRHPTVRKIIIVPQVQFGRALEDALARQTGGWVGLTCTSVADYARTLAHPAVLEEERTPLPTGGTLFLAAQAVQQLPEATREALQVEGQRRVSPGAAQALAHLFKHLRTDGVAPNAFRTAAATDRRRAEAEAYAGYVRLLRDGRYADEAAVLTRAIEAVQSARVSLTNTACAVLDEVELSRLEQRFLHALRDAASAFCRIGAPNPADTPAGRAGCLMQTVDGPTGSDAASGSRAEVDCDTATGAEQEVRAVVRDLLTKAESDAALTFDQVEVAYTDADRYLPLLTSVAARHDVPVSVSVGMPMEHTRPGQAVQGVLEWIRDGFEAPPLIRMLRGGLVRIDRIQNSEPVLSGPHAATRLASLRYEAGRDGYRKALRYKVEQLEQERERTRRRDAQAASALREELAAWKQLWAVVQTLLNRIPSGTVEVADMARALREVVIRFGPVDEPPDGEERTLDQAARNRLIEQFQQIETASFPGRASVPEQAGRLAQALSGSRVEAERPTPGKVFLVPLESAGFSGREHLYVVGLDSESVGNYVSGSSAPVTDRERGVLEEAVGQPLHALREPTDGVWAIRRARRRHSGSMTIYARSYDVRDGEPRYPSTLFLEWGGAQARAITDTDSDYTPLSIPTLGRDGNALTLDADEDWMAAYVRGERAEDDAFFTDQYPGAAGGLRASRQRASDRYTAYDGLLADGDYPELDILGNITLSPGRLETLATTPYLYFLEHVLHVCPLDEPALDDQAWLDAGRRGTILHDTFARFMRTHAGQLHAEEAGNWLDQILRERLAEEARQLAPPNDFIEQSTERQLRADAQVFLQAERAHDSDGTPHRFELGFGLPPHRREEGDTAGRAEIDAGGGQALSLRGKVDRIDRHPDGTLSIWDYKTGRAKAFNEADPLQSGTTMQWALYSYAMEALLGATVREAGYFFTSTKEMGRRIAFRPRAYRDELNVILHQLSALARSGTFPMVDNAHQRNRWKYRGFERLHPDLRARTKELTQKDWDDQRPVPPHLNDS